MSDKVISVVACVIEFNGKYLITQRLKQSHLGHLWEFPGGKLELGETLEQCAIRECQEELAIEVKPIALIDELRHPYEEFIVHLYFMQCQWLSGIPQTIECADFAWVLPEQLDEYPFPKADQALLQKLQKKN